MTDDDARKAQIAYEKEVLRQETLRFLDENREKLIRRVQQRLRKEYKAQLAETHRLAREERNRE